MNYLSYDSNNKVLISCSDDGSSRININSRRSPFLLQIDHKKLVVYNEERYEIKKVNLENIIENIDPENASTYTIKNEISLLTLCIIARLPELLQQLLDTIGFGEIESDDPLHPVIAAAKIKDRHIMDVLGRYLLEEPCVDVTQDMLFQTLETESVVFMNAIMNNLFEPGDLQTKDIPQSLPMEPSNFPYIMKLPGKKISGKQLLDLSNEGSSNLVTVKYGRAFPKLDYSLGSTFSLNFLHYMERFPILAAESESKNLVLHYWENYYHYAYVYVFIYISFLVCFFISAIWCREASTCEVFFDSSIGSPLRYVFLGLMILLYLILVVFEILVHLRRLIIFFCKPKAYKTKKSGLSRSKIWKQIVKQWKSGNIVDAFIFIFFIPIAITIFLSNNREDSKWVNLIYTTYLFVLGFRGLLHLKVIDNVRYLISMIVQACWDMIPFFIVLILSVVIFSCLEINISKSIDGTEADSFTYQEFLKKINQVYDVGFGNWDGAGDYPANLYTLFMFQNILFPLVMFNLLIAIISKTYEDFEENKDRVDIEELIAILIDYSLLFSYRPRSSKKKSEGYLHVFTLVEEEDQNSENISDIKDKVNKLSAKMDSNFSTIIKKINELNNK